MKFLCICLLVVLSPARAFGVATDLYDQMESLGNPVQDVSTQVFICCGYPPKIGGVTKRSRTMLSLVIARVKKIGNDEYISRNVEERFHDDSLFNVLTPHLFPPKKVACHEKAWEKLSELTREYSHSGDANYKVLTLDHVREAQNPNHPDYTGYRACFQKF